MDPRDHPAAWFVMRCTGGTDAWTDPVDDPDDAWCDQVAAWVVAVAAMMMMLGFAGVLVMEVARAWA